MAIRTQGASPTAKSAVDLTTLPEEWAAVGRCSNPKMVRGSCDEHGQVRWGLVPCGVCDSCEAEKRRKHARRIAYGIRESWPAALVVLTFDPHEDGNDCRWHPGHAPDAECLECKAFATREVSYLVRGLRKLNPAIQYASTYEKHASGVLHINVVLVGWTQVDQPLLERVWGRRLSVSWVMDAESASGEAAKSVGKRKKTPDFLAVYMNKLSQSVENGRSVSFSRGFPKPPEPPKGERQGKTSWRPLTSFERAQLERDSRRGLVTMPEGAGTLAGTGLLVHEEYQQGRALCGCFEQTFDDAWWSGEMATQRARHALHHKDAPWKDARKPLVPVKVQKTLGALIKARRAAGEVLPVVDVTKLANAYSGVYLATETKGGKVRHSSPWWLGSDEKPRRSRKTEIHESEDAPKTSPLFVEVVQECQHSYERVSHWLVRCSGCGLERIELEVKA